MDTILDMKKVFVSSVCFSLLTTDVTGDNYFYFSFWVIALAFFWKNGAGHQP